MRIGDTSSKRVKIVCMYVVLLILEDHIHYWLELKGWKFGPKVMERFGGVIYS